MKNRFLIIPAIFSLLIFSQCGKDDSGENWAAAVAGTYTGSTTFSCDPGIPSGSCTFTRTGDKQLAMEGTYSIATFCLDSITMDSTTTFIVNERDPCNGRSVTGYGAFSDNHVNFTLDYGYCISTVQGSK